MGIKSARITMSTGSRAEVLNPCIVHPRLIGHCMLTLLELKLNTLIKNSLKVKYFLTEGTCTLHHESGSEDTTCTLRRSSYLWDLIVIYYKVLQGRKHWCFAPWKKGELSYTAEVKERAEVWATGRGGVELISNTSSCIRKMYRRNSDVRKD